MASAKTWQRGRPDAQALLVRARASLSIATALVEHDPKDGRPWIPPGSEFDPRLYIGSNRPQAKRQGKIAARLTALAEFMVEQDKGVETVSRWRRDLQGWLSAERTVSPDKLRVFAIAVKVSWFRLFFEVGYHQHLLVAIGKLLDESRFGEAAILSAFMFRDWTFEDQFVTLDLFVDDGLFNRALSCVEKCLGFWPTVPARIEVGEIKNDALRCVLRLCDPEDWQNMKDGALRYPCEPARKASVVLLRGLFPNDIDPFDPKALKEMTKAVISARSNEVGK